MHGSVRNVHAYIYKFQWTIHVTYRGLFLLRPIELIALPFQVLAFPRLGVITPSTFRMPSILRLCDAMAVF